MKISILFGIGLFLFVAGVVAWTEIPPPPDFQFVGKTILASFLMVFGGSLIHFFGKK